MSTPTLDDALATVRSLDLFRELPAPLLEALAGAMELRAVAAGEVLIRQGETGEAMFVVRSGVFRIMVQENEVARFGPGAHFGEIQLLTAGARTATVIADVDAQVYQLHRAALDGMGQFAGPFTDRLAATALHRMQSDELASVMRTVMGPLEPEVIEALQRVIKWTHLQRGEALFKQGDPGDAWYIVISGRLEIEIADVHGERQIIGQVGRGDSLGEIAILTGEPRSATPYAVRDARIARIDKEDFEAIMLRFPAVLLSVSRTLSRTLTRRTSGAPRRQQQRLSVAVVGSTPDAPRAWVTERLVGALSQAGTVLHLSSARLAQLSVVERASQLGDDHPAWRRFANWLEQAETEHDFVVFEADAELNAWTKRCLRHSDHSLIVAQAVGAPAPTPLERALFDRGREGRLGARVSLVLVHPTSLRLPSGTAAWLQARPFVQRHHHVQAERASDVERIGRLLAGRGVGLTLGGGGARGFAHLGVIRAMQELGLPIDCVGGTSMGSIMAGQYAMGLSLDEAFEINARIAASRPFREFTLPVFAVMRSRRIDESARMSFGDVEIEDLWTPFFCISANLTKAEMITHERGPLWRATRASGSLPGIALPVVEGDNLLVDGGIINNLPGDIMRKRCGGAVIAVDVSPEEDVSIAREGFPSPWAVLWSRIFPFRKRIIAPSINDILMRTLMLGSASRTNQVRREVDVYLRPPIGRFGMLEFESMKAIADVGYECARAELPAWLETWRAPKPG